MSDKDGPEINIAARDLQENISRRSFLRKLGKATLGIAAMATPIGVGKAEEAVSVEVEKSSPDWGTLGNEGHEKDFTRGIFFFAGPPNPNSRYPHLHPVTDWSSDADIEKIFDEIKSANVNVINLSWWGDHDETQKWAPTINSKEVNDRVFREAKERSILVAPVLEVSPEFEFFKDFPDHTEEFEKRLESLLSTYGENENWVKIIDKNGEKRHFIRLIESIHLGQIDEVKFAQTFNTVADKVFQKTGKKVIFGIDPTPLPPNGSDAGPNIEELKKINSVIITPYNIFSDGDTEDERIEKAGSIMQRWIDSEIPIILPLMTGFDDTGTDRPITQKFGNSDEWLSKIKNFFGKYSSCIKGVNFDSWNTYTEGGSVAPTKEYGDANLKFAKLILIENDLNPIRDPLIKQGIIPMISSDS